ncbi:MAG: 3-isopropylmalate dehydratase large subunit [Deltaproteobacteria bacterium]|nr:3-isopropylmalate dehydratase large subunit [Deltaproteobacteria bacterium]
MGMTIAEKILASHSGREKVSPGEYVWADIDAAEIPNVLIETSPVHWLEKLGINKLFNPERIYIRNSNLPTSIGWAENTASLRKLAKKYGISHWFEYGRNGVIHHVNAEAGCAAPGELIVMADSHTTTYGAFNCASTGVQVEITYVLATGKLWFRVPESIKFLLEGEMPDMCVGKDVILKIAADYGTDVAIYKSAEFLGPAAREMSIDSRFSIANMGVEIGAKFALFETDEKTLAFLKGRINRRFTPVSPDKDAIYEKVYTLDVSDLEPMVACPHDPSNSRPVGEVAGVRINQGFIGSCTNGRHEDLEMAARILHGKKVHPDVRLLISPGSMEIWRDALEAGWIKTFVEAEALVLDPSCAPCSGMAYTTLADGERCISTTNRNFQGRMGSPHSEVYLANSATVAVSAIAGEITDPRKI